MRLTVPAVLFFLFSSPAVRAQQGSIPTFRAGIDLLTVEAIVLGKEGRPIADLQPGDFNVTVDGQPRKVLFARFYSSDASSATMASVVTGEPAAVAVALDNLSRPPGRVVVFVVDRESIRGGTEAALLDSAMSVLKALGPEDAAGALGLPNSTVSLTRDHAQVTEALRQLTGTMPWDGYRWTLSFEEAAEIERSHVTPGWGTDRTGDNRVLEEVYARECRTAVVDPAGVISVPEGCDKSIITQANEMLLKARTHAREVLGALTNLATGLKRVRGPKRIVFVSGGLRFDQTMIQDFDAATRAINAAGISLDTIHLDVPPTDAATMRRATTDPYGGREMSSGLTTLAGMTGGSFFYGVGRAVGVFDRITAEVANFYELGLETVPSDADGKSRDVEVKVNRADVVVRARKQVTLPIVSAAAARGSTAVLELMQQPTDIADLRLVLSGYTTRGDEASLLKLLMSVQIDAPQARAPVAWAFIVTLDGNVVANGRQTVTSERPWTVTPSAKLAPGKYRVRFVAADADGRSGVLDVPLTVGLHQAGPVQTSDAIVGVVTGDRLQPCAAVDRGADGVVMIELLSPDPDLLARTVAILDIIPGGSADPAQRYRMAVQSSSTTSVLIAEGHFRTTTLAPGRYTASVVTLVDNQPSDSRSQLAVPLLAGGALVGVLFVEDVADRRFGYDDEDALLAIAGLLGPAIRGLQACADDADDALAQRPGQARVLGPALKLRHYSADDSIFFGDDYLIKGVAGAILWKLVGDYARAGRTDFTNRELRLDPAIRLPDLFDNLEARLILLQRRLAERSDAVRIEKTGRGRFRLCVQRPVELHEIAAGARAGN